MSREEFILRLAESPAGLYWQGLDYSNQIVHVWCGFIMVLQIFLFLYVWIWHGLAAPFPVQILQGSTDLRRRVKKEMDLYAEAAMENEEAFIITGPDTTQEDSDSEELPPVRQRAYDALVHVWSHLYRYDCPPSRADVCRYLSTTLDSAEERSRALMNNIIILGLLGTVGSLAMSYLFGLKATDLIHHLPLAFIPAGFGLLLSFFLSLIIIRKSTRAHEEVECIAGHLLSTLPPRNMTQSFKLLLSGLNRTINESLVDSLDMLTDSWTQSFTPAIQSITGAIKSLEGKFDSFNHAVSALQGFSSAMQRSIDEFNVIMKRLSGEMSAMNEGILQGFDRNAQALDEVSLKTLKALNRFEESQSELKNLYIDQINDLKTQFDAHLNRITERNDGHFSSIVSELHTNVTKYLSDSAVSLERQFVRLSEEVNAGTQDRVRQELTRFEKLGETLKQLQSGYGSYVDEISGFNQAVDVNIVQMTEMYNTLTRAMEHSVRFSEGLSSWQQSLDTGAQRLEGIGALVENLNRSVAALSQLTTQTYQERSSMTAQLLKRINTLSETIEYNSRSIDAIKL